jgi:hypothetical protein
MSDIDTSYVKTCAYTHSSPAMTPKFTTSKAASSLLRVNQPLRVLGSNMICLFCDRCGRPFYTNSHRSPLCGICLRATQT